MTDWLVYLLGVVSGQAFTCAAYLLGRHEWKHYVTWNRFGDDGLCVWWPGERGQEHGYRIWPL